MPSVKEEKKNDRKYPAVILGLDISTSCIGVSIVVDDGESDPKIVEITHISPKIPSKKKGIEALILRKEIFEDEFLSKIDMDITECIIEAPIEHTTSKSNYKAVVQLLQFNGLISEAVYRTLGIIPEYISSYDARRWSFPELLSIRKFNKKGEPYDIATIKRSLKNNNAVLFGSYPFDCDKKCVMMDMVTEKYPDIKWVKDDKGNIRKENYDACDSLVCALAHINLKRYGEPQPEIKNYSIIEENDNYAVGYTVGVWDKRYGKIFTIPKVEKKKKKTV